MGDMYCRNPRCQEPWDAYEVMHGLSARERQQFLAGKGCPSCEFGQKASDPTEIAWEVALVRFKALLHHESDFVQRSGPDASSSLALNPIRLELFQMMYALVTELHECTCTWNEPMKVDSLRALVANGEALTLGAEILNWRVEVLNLLAQMGLSPDSVPPEVNAVALERFQHGLAEWDEDLLS